MVTVTSTSNPPATGFDAQSLSQRKHAHWWHRQLHTLVDGDTLGVFRCGFAALLCWDLLQDLPYAASKYPVWEFKARPTWLAWTAGWPSLDPTLNVLGLVIAALFVALGLGTRLWAALFAAGYWYLRLYDESLFNNHDYLICLLMLAFVFVRSDAVCSVRACWGPPARCWIPGWQLRLIVAHFCLVYLWGGYVKLNSDWLAGEPMQIWSATSAQVPLIGPLLTHRWAGMILAWGGLFFDSFIWLALLWRPTRWPAFLATFGFHLTNSQVFEIGPFPWLMLWSNFLFLEPGSLRRCWQWVANMLTGSASSSTAPPPSADFLANTNPWISRLLICYLTFHMLWPLRYLTTDGWVEWTEESKYYSWRMMLSYKETFLGLRVIDGKTGRSEEVDLTRYLTGRHMRGKGVWGNPRHLAQFARHVAEDARRRGFDEPLVKAEAICSLNGRPFQYLIDPDIDLASAEIPWWGTPNWVIPLAPGQPLGAYCLQFEEKFTRITALMEAHRRDPRVLLETLPMPASPPAVMMDRPAAAPDR